MNKLPGTPQKSLGFRLTKQGDLYYMEGPLLSHFKNEHGEDFLMHWVDETETGGRWLLNAISLTDLIGYLNSEVSLLDLVMRNETGTVHLLDIDSDAVFSNIRVVAVSELPEQYLPSAESFFSEKAAHQYAVNFKEQIRHPQQDFQHLFIASAAKTLLPHEDFAPYVLASPSPLLWNFSPDNIDEFVAIKMMIFPLLAHYSFYKHDNYMLLIDTHSQAFNDPYSYRNYLSNVFDLVNSNYEGASQLQTPSLTGINVLRYLMQSTQSIADRSETIKKLLKLWRDRMAGEYKNIDALQAGIMLEDE